MFEIGKYVAYRSEGVCIISDIRAESFGADGTCAQYYILTPIHDKRSTLFVPVDNERLTSLMRALMSAEQINEMAAELRETRLEWIADCRSRNNEFREILSLGERRELAVLALTVADKIDETVAAGKKVGSTEASALRRALRMLYEEFSVTTDIRSAEDIIPFLRGEFALCDKA